MDKRQGRLLDHGPSTLHCLRAFEHQLLAAAFSG